MKRRIEKKPGKKTVLAAKILHCFSSVVFMVCGILLLTVREFNESTRYVLVGAASILSSAAGIFGYFSNDIYRLAFHADFALGIFNILFGGLLIVNPMDIPILLPCVISIITMLDGGNKLQIAYEGYKFGLEMWMLVLASGVIETLLGLTLLTCTVYGLPTGLWAGVAPIVVGAVNFWTTMYTVRVNGGNRGTED